MIGIQTSTVLIPGHLAAGLFCIAATPAGFMQGPNNMVEMIKPKEAAAYCHV
jgi:hypothetical protein